MSFGRKMKRGSVKGENMTDKEERRRNKRNVKFKE
jgi:hypothetical protein